MRWQPLLYAVGPDALLRYDGSEWSQISGLGGGRVWGLGREHVFVVGESYVVHGTP